MGSQLLEARGKGMTENGSGRHYLMVASQPVCTIYHPSSCHSIKGNSSIPLGAGPYLSSHPCKFPNLDKIRIREGCVGKKTCGSEIWSKGARVDSEGKPCEPPVLGTQRQLCRVTNVRLGGCSSQVTRGSSLPLAYRKLQIGTEF